MLDVSYDGHWIYHTTKSFQSRPPIPQLENGTTVRVIPTGDNGSFGSAGIVDCEGGDRFCVKVFHRDAGPDAESVEAAMDQEIKKLLSLDGLLECDVASTPRVYSEGQAWLGFRASQYAYCMDRVPGVKLYDAVTGGLLSGHDGGAGILPPAYRVAQVGLNLVEGYKAMHDRGVVHRDGNPDNLYVDIASGDHIWIIDFGSSINLVNPSRTVCRLASPAYGAPEVFDGDPSHAENRWGPEQDIYTLGALLCFMRTGEHPRLSEYTPTGVHIDYVGPKKRPLELSEELTKAESSTRWVKNLEMGPGDNILADIIRRCTKFDKEERPSLSEVRNALWLISLSDPQEPRAEAGKVTEALKASGMPTDLSKVDNGLVAYGWAERSWNMLASYGGLEPDCYPLPYLGSMPFKDEELDAPIGFFERAISLGVKSLKTYVNAARLLRWQVFYRVSKANWEKHGYSPSLFTSFSANSDSHSPQGSQTSPVSKDATISGYKRSRGHILAALDELERGNSLTDEEANAFFRVVDSLIPPSIPSDCYSSRWPNWEYSIGADEESGKAILLCDDISDFAGKALLRLRKVTSREASSKQRIAMLLALSDGFEMLNAYREERSCLEEALKFAVGDEALEAKVRLADLYRRERLKGHQEIERLYREVIGPAISISGSKHRQKPAVKRAAEGLLQLQGDGPFPLRVIKERNTLMKIAGRKESPLYEPPWKASAIETMENPHVSTFIDFLKSYPLWGGAPMKKNDYGLSADDIMAWLHDGEEGNDNEKRESSRK